MTMHGLLLARRSIWQRHIKKRTRAMPTLRTMPMRKPEGFKPAVQRWSARFSDDTTDFVVGYHGVQGADDAALQTSPFLAWKNAALAHVAGPEAHDMVRFVDAAGKINHVLIAYWTTIDRFQAWRMAKSNVAFWENPARVSESTGYFREELRVQVDGYETIYFLDLPFFDAQRMG